MSYLKLIYLVWVFLLWKIEKTTSNEVIYSKSFQMSNNITGTGNELLDVAYRTKCQELECVDCCEGEIDKMMCGSYKSCKKYRLLVFRHHLVIVILCVSFPYLLIPALWMLLYCTNKDKHPKFHKITSKIFFLYTCILLPPYGLMKLLEFFWPKLGSVNDLDKQRDEKIPTAFNELFKEKEFVRQNYVEGISRMNEQNQEDDYELAENKDVALDNSINAPYDNYAGNVNKFIKREDFFVKIDEGSQDDQRK